MNEILAVVNHELGHVAYMHTVLNTVMSSIQIVGMFTVFTYSLGNTAMLQSFGFDLASTATSNGLYLYIFMSLIGNFMFPLQFLTSFISRVCEY